MNEQEKQQYHERYEEAKEKGVPFFPDILVKDAAVSLVVFLILVGLAFFLGAPLEPRANPADTSYTPRPEWYFLFLYQLLKYFPGKLEVIGVILIPALVILFLLALPLLDRSARRHIRARLVFTGVVGLGVVGVVALTILSVLQAPPPSEVTGGDQTAALYSNNCAACHGPSIIPEPGTNLHEVIALGKHEGMPAWSADLSSDQIDALVGFILSPNGSRLFTENCGACHDASQVVGVNPLDLKSALDDGPSFTAHAGLEVPIWAQTLTSAERSALLNFLVAPDGQRLFAVNCSPCHGTSVAFSGEEAELRSIITEGGMHLSMPPWREMLSPADLDTLARYVVNPSSEPAGQELFAVHCATCHGQRVPSALDVAQATEAIASGGAHETMPLWGAVLTPEQLDALVAYTLQAAKGVPTEIGQQLFGQYCGSCHGEFGEGGANPSLPGDIIPPISSAEYLKTRDDATLRNIIAQGQPDFGMSPFGDAFGGPLDDTQIDAIIAYLRSWEANPPVLPPPQITVTPVALTGRQVYDTVCAQCHGVNGEGRVGPSLVDSTFQAQNTDQQISDAIAQGVPGSVMVGWEGVLSATQIQDLVALIRQFAQPSATPAPGAVSFSADVMPIFQASCLSCHGALGGWDGSTYQLVMSSGDHAPVVVPGDAENSLLAQKLLDTQAEGTVMPPWGMLPQDQIQLILDWILAGAPDN